MPFFKGSEKKLVKKE